MEKVTHPKVEGAAGRYPECPPSSAPSPNCKFDGTDYPSWLGYDPYKSPEDPFTFPMPSTDGDPWEKTANLVKRHDDNMCDAWVDEIQNNLIFAGLFSAVVTAFAVETQKLLQPDPAITSVHLLAQLTNHFTPNSTITNPIPPSQDSSTSLQSLRINIFIFVSLVFSLGTALVGIIALQWIRSYRELEPLSHQEQLCVRQSRYEGLVKWKVPDLIAVLPITLQMSLVVFFAGLLDFLHYLNTKVALIIGCFVAVILLGVFLTTMLPGLYVMLFHERGKQIPLPPYHSPQAWLFYRAISLFMQLFLNKNQRPWQCWHRHPSWTRLITTYDNSFDHWLKPALLWVFRHLPDEDSFAMAYQSFKSLADKEIAQSLVLDHMTPSHLKPLHNRFKDSCPAAAEQIPSILLLRWDKFRRPLHQRVHLHLTELSLRCLSLGGLNSRLLTSDVDPNGLLDLMYPLLDPRTGNGPQVVTEAKTCVFLTLSLMPREPPSDALLGNNSRSHRWYIFWTCIIRLQGFNHHDVVDDALHTLAHRLSSAVPEDPVHGNVLAKCPEGLFESLTDRQEDRLVLESLFHRQSFLKFLDCFTHSSHFRHKIWKDILFSTHEHLRERWDGLLHGVHLHTKYRVLGYDRSYFHRPLQHRPDIPTTSTLNVPINRIHSHHSPFVDRHRPTLPATARFLLPFTNFHRRFRLASSQPEVNPLPISHPTSAVPLQPTSSHLANAALFTHDAHSADDVLNDPGDINIVIDKPEGLPQSEGRGIQVQCQPHLP